MMSGKPLPSHKFTLPLLTLFFLSIVTAHGQAPTTPTLRDTMSDSWVATDALERTTLTGAKTGPPRSGRFVGMFYSLRLGAHGRQGPFDITQILADHPDAMNEPDNPAWGPPNSFHHWGKPL